MRLVARIDQRTTIHGVNTYQHTEKIRALRNLKNTRLARRALRFDAHLSCAGEDLACDEKRQNAGDDAVPCDPAAHQVIIVTAVTVPDKVAVVLVKTDFVAGRQFLVSTPRAFGQDALAGLVLCHDLPERRAFRSRIFRMRVVVVESGAI